METTASTNKRYSIKLELQDLDITRLEEGKTLKAIIDRIKTPKGAYFPPVKNIEARIGRSEKEWIDLETLTKKWRVLITPKGFKYLKESRYICMRINKVSIEIYYKRTNN